MQTEIERDGRGRRILYIRLGTGAGTIAPIIDALAEERAPIYQRGHKLYYRNQYTELKAENFLRLVRRHLIFKPRKPTPAAIVTLLLSRGFWRDKFPRLP